MIDVESTVGGAWEPVEQTDTDHAADQSTAKPARKTPVRKKAKGSEENG